MFGAFIRALAFALALFPALAGAQSPIVAFPPGTFQSRSAIDASTATYTGPGDVVTFTSFGSCAFAYTAAYATALNSACDLVDTATGTFACTLKFAANGAADLTSLLCTGGTLSVTTFCTVTHAAGCSIAKVYDQTANGHDWTQATLANMPPLVLSGIGTSPIISCKASVVLTSNSITLTVPFSIEGVLELPGSGPTANAFVFSSNANQTQVLWLTTAQIGQTSGGSAVNPTAASAGAGHAVQASFASGTNNTVLNVDGSSTTATTTPGTSTATSTICRNAGITNGNYVGEIGTNAQSAYNSTLRANVLTRWGI